MKQIRKNLYLGDIEDAKNAKLLKSIGITTILSVCRSNFNLPEGIKILKVGLEDSSNNESYMISLAVYVLKRLLKEGEKVLVHCDCGIFRSPFIIASYLAIKESKTLEEAYKELKEIAPEISDDNLLTKK